MPGQPPSGLIVDFYGVLTVDLDSAMTAWADSDGIDYLSFREAMADWFGEAGAVTVRLNPVHALERGELEVPDFEQQLAKRLRSWDGTPVAADGLVGRMFNQFQHAPDMAGLVRRARSSGLRTALLSNSWGDQYFRTGWGDMFDAVVISGEVNMRKPERQIFEYTLRELRLDARECVFVDDHEQNVSAAAKLGLIGIHHTDYESTAAELEVIFDRPLAG